MRSAPPWWRLDRWVCISSANRFRNGGAAPRWSRLAPTLQNGTSVRPKRRQQKGRLSLHAVAAARKGTRSAPPWWRLDRCVCISSANRFRNGGAAPRWPRLAPMFRDRRSVRSKKRQQKENPRNLRFLGGCGQSPSGPELLCKEHARKNAQSLRRNPSPPEPKIKRRINASFFCPRSADAVGRATNFRANFHGAAAKLNALQAFNAPTHHGNSRNGGLRPRATADAQRATRSARRWSALDRCGTFLMRTAFELTALRRCGNGLRLCSGTKSRFVQRSDSHSECSQANSDDYTVRSIFSTPRPFLPITKAASPFRIGGFAHSSNNSLRICSRRFINSFITCTLSTSS